MRIRAVINSQQSTKILLTESTRMHIIIRPTPRPQALKQKFYFNKDLRKIYFPCEPEIAMFLKTNVQCLMKLVIIDYATA